MENEIKITLAAARVNAGLTQPEVAKALNISSTTLVSWEKYRVIVSYAQAERLSQLYGIPKNNIKFS